MNEHDFLNIWVIHANFLLTLFVAFISGTSGYLIVANVKGKVLNSKLFALVTGLYILAATYFILFYAKVCESMLNIRSQMIDADMGWYNVVYEPQSILPILMTIGGVLMISLAMGSIWYFSSIRRNNDS